MEKPIGCSNRIGIGQQLVDFSQFFSFKIAWGDTLHYIHVCQWLMFMPYLATNDDGHQYCIP
jgi:hypothetical protein